jgi:predicted nucleotidyltransferase
MNQREAIEKVQQYKLLLTKYFDLDKVYLYGSFAKNTNNEDSDIDVAIIVNNLSSDYFSTTPLIWKLRRQIDDRIEPILLDKGNDLSGFVAEIQKYGIEII